MVSIINAVSGGNGGLVSTGDTSGVLQLQVGGNAALTMNADKSVQFESSGITKSILETVNISATAATGTVNVDIATSVVWYYTSNASANWTFNFRANSTTTLDSFMSVGQSVTVAFLVQLGATPRYVTGISVDGNSVTPVWPNGSAPSSSSANALDIYVFTIIKTSSNVFKVIGQQSSYS